MICILLSKKILKHNEFNKVKSALKICPICYHKLIILKRTDDNIQSNVNNGKSSSCLLCKSKKNLIQIKNWTNFDLILEDMAFSKTSDCMTCSDCLFYLHTKTEIRTKLFAKYPQLKNSKDNKRKFKLKFSPNMKLQSTPISTRKRGRGRPLRVVNISSIIDLTTDTTINLDSLKKLRPLKKYRSFRNLKVVKADPKFLDQIPYVLINISAVHSDSSDEDSGMSDKEVFRDKVKRKPGLKTASKSSKVNLKKDLYKFGIVKDLIVNVSRIRIEKYLGNSEPDPDIQNLIDKFNILQPSYEEEKSSPNTSNITEPDDSLIEESELSFDMKNKRKSVSFAEEKNVEIEYFDDISNLKSSNENLDENSVEVVGKKQNKGILKHDEQNTAASEDNDECNETEEKKELLNSSTYEEDKETSIDSETSSDPGKEKKLRNRRNTVTQDNDDERDVDNAEEFSDSDEIKLVDTTKVSDSSVEPVNDSSVDQKEKESNESRPKPKRDKPKPLSKKKKQNASINAVTDEPINTNNSDDKSQESEKESPINDQRLSDETKSKTEERVSKEMAGEENSPLVPEQSMDEEKSEDETTKKDKVSLLSKRRMSCVDISESVEEIDPEADNESVNEDEPIVKKPKKNRPMPLSRKKMCKKAENMGDDANREKSSTSDVENVKGSVEKAKRQKPGPLSKKKKIVVDEPKVVEKNENFEIIDLDSEDKNIDDSNEKETPTDSGDTSRNETQTDSELSKADPIVEQEGLNESGNSSGDITKEDVSTSLEKNRTDSVLSDKNEVNSSNLISKENSMIEKNTNVLELCDDVLNKDTVDVNEKKNETDNSLDTSDDTTKPTSMSDSVTNLVNKYLISPDNDSFINNPEKDDSLEQPTNRSFDKDSDEELTAVTNSDNSLNKKMDSVGTDSFSEFEKNEELGISEVDNENINSLLSTILPPELSESTFDTINEKSENDLCDDSQDSHCNVKRKATDDELDVSKEKKKKRVTFCDDVT